MQGVWRQLDLVKCSPNYESHCVECTDGHHCYDQWNRANACVEVHVDYSITLLSVTEHYSECWKCAC